MDAETQAIYQEGEAVAEYIHSRAWPYLKTHFDHKLLDLQSTRNIKPGKPEDIALEVSARNAAVDILLEFWREMEGIAAQHSANNNLMNLKNEIIIQD